MLDPRLSTYFALTTVNVALDLVFEEEKVFLAACLLLRQIVCVVLATTSSEKTRARMRYPMAFSILLLVGYWFNRIPFTWESNVWSLQVDLLVSLWLLFGPSWNDTTQVSQLSNTIIGMYCWYYAASGFFKINSHFLDPDASCATVFVVMHTAYYAGPFLSEDTLIDVCRMLKPWGPAFTLLIELSMGGLLMMGKLLNNRWWLTTGILLIVYFHLAVCATPKPLDISMFAYQCGARLIWGQHPQSLQSALSRLYPYTGWLLSFAVIFVAFGVQANFTPLNWAFACFVPVLVLHQLSIAIEAPTFSIQSSGKKSQRTWWSILAISFAAFYSFGCLQLGLMEEMTPNMFANLMTHGGSNHYLVPTGLLLSKRPEIRIEQTTSRWFTIIYPADFSHIVEPNPTAANILDAIGNHPPSYLNPGANRVLGLLQKGWVSHNGVFIPYTVPSVEFQRLFSEALEKDKTFTLIYAELPTPPVNDEVWRATAVDRRIQVTIKDGKVVQCKVLVDSNRGNDKACDPSGELIYTYNNISWWTDKFSVYHGYPILFENDGKTPRKSITCFGP